VATISSSIRSLLAIFLLSVSVATRSANCTLGYHNSTSRYLEPLAATASSAYDSSHEMTKQVSVTPYRICDQCLYQTATEADTSLRRTTVIVLLQYLKAGAVPLSSTLILSRLARPSFSVITVHSPRRVRKEIGSFLPAC
jgi:hypothetical protein